MIRSVKIENFKSIRELELELGRVTVLIGANGSGKSNILEAIGMASAVASDKLDNEFLASRGIRMPENLRMMLSAFADHETSSVSTIRIALDKGAFIPFTFTQPDDPDQIKQLPGWFTPNSQTNDVVFNNRIREQASKLLSARQWALESIIDDHDLAERNYLSKLASDLAYSNKYLADLQRAESAPQNLGEHLDLIALRHFLIYAPENRELRTFAEEGQILPLGIRGEGLFRLLKIMAGQDDGKKLAILKEKLQLIEWFEGFDFPTDAVSYERSLRIKDRHLSDDLAYIDQRSANEGFLYLLFYFALLISDATPPFFAIDNIDASLNPKLCERLIQEMVELAKANGKQFIVTTHNPAILDGLNLHDDEQRLYSIRRNRNGETRADRIEAPKVEEGQTPVRLSEAYLRGYLGGLPTNF